MDQTKLHEVPALACLPQWEGPWNVTEVEHEQECRASTNKIAALQAVHCHMHRPGSRVFNKLW